MDTKLVVALDIGTTYSGYAWQWREDFTTNPANVGLYKWKGGLCKTATSILFSNVEKWDVQSIGYTAETRYGEHGGKKENKNWRLFRNFKMPLYGEKFNEDVRTEDVEGQEHVPLKDIMTEFIKQLKQHFFKDDVLKGITVKETDIKWVITVPAIWNEAAKDLMRHCAMQSGISATNIQLALEPEAAAVYCIHLSKEERRALGGLGNTGDSFILADLGGGTADISVQYVAADGKLEQLCAADGRNIGGRDINNAFFLACKDEFVGDSWYDAWTSLNGEDRLQAQYDFESDFEMKKVTIGREECDELDLDEWVRVKLPFRLSTMCINGQLRLKPGNKYFRITCGQFQFNPQYVREHLFDTTVSNIFDVLKNVIYQDKVTDVKKVVLVGGLSESRIVIEKLKMRLNTEFPTRGIQVFAPKSPMYAVLQGAVMFGHEPEIFKTRISRYTYGVCAFVPFKEGVHPKEKKVALDDNVYCKDIFDIHVKRNQAVKINERLAIQRYRAVNKDQRAIEIELFASSNVSPTYVDESNCTPLATIRIDLDEDTEGTLEVSMIYGGNEIRVEAIEKGTGKVHRTQISFHSIPTRSIVPKRCTLM